MLADNIRYLKKNNPILLEFLQTDTLPGDYILSKTESKSQKTTLRFEKKGQMLFLHSKYDPQREAQSIINQLENETDQLNQRHVIFWGVGLGYHLEEFVRRYTDVDFSIFDPSKEIFLEFLSQQSLDKLGRKHLRLIQCGDTENDVINFFNALVKITNKEIVICELPVYQKIFNKERTLFFEQLKIATKRKRDSLATNFVFKKRWILNSAVNFSEILITPNILMEHADLFKNQTAVLISAGPSLDLETENLKKIKMEKSAYLFSVGSAINSLIEKGVYPDAMCTYDPQGLNQQVFEKVATMGIASIPMIFGSSVGFETLQLYQGPKFHMITSQDTISQYFLKSQKNRELDTVADAPSIAVMTLELLQRLGFKEIVLVGQNLAFINESYYASGIEYEKDPKLNNQVDFIEVPGVTEDKVLTNESLNRMRKDMETRIALSDVPVFNTTVGGAAIAGTVYKNLDKVMMENLKGSFKTTAFDLIKADNFYDLNYLKIKLISMKSSFESYKEIIQTVKQQLIKIDELVNNKNLKQSEVMYKMIDRLLGKLETNDFAKVFEIPMNRVEYEILAVNLERIRSEKKGLIKMKELVALLDVFINRLLQGQSTDIKIIANLEQAITAYENELTKIMELCNEK